MKSTSVSKLPMPLWYSQYNSPFWPYLKYILMNSISFAIGKHQHARFSETNWCSDVLKENNIQQIMFWTLMSLPPKHSDKNNPATLKFFAPVWGWWNLAVIFGPTGWTMVAWPELWYIFYKQKVPTNKIGGTLPCKDSNTLHLDTLDSNIYYICHPSVPTTVQYIV